LSIVLIQYTKRPGGCREAICQHAQWSAYLQTAGPADRKRGYREILKPGDQLPTVREVALELTVNPNTVARAYRELEHRGIIESFQGRGTFIAGSVRPPLAAEKELLIKQQLDELLQEARQLNIKPADLKRIFEIALKQWDKEV
jgi:GntR family transcriptional regulator